MGRPGPYLVATRLAGREFRAADVTYDEEFPDDAFQLDLPGVEFRSIVR